MQCKSVLRNALKDGFFSVKLEKIPGFGEISFNVIKKFFAELCEPLVV